MNRVEALRAEYAKYWMEHKQWPSPAYDLGADLCFMGSWGAGNSQVHGFYIGPIQKYAVYFHLNPDGSIVVSASEDRGAVYPPDYPRVQAKAPVKAGGGDEGRE
ncbi:MAG: hypothetical protein ACYTKD_26720 [Planctomycetota bacterium]